MRPTYTSILGLKSISAEFRVSFDASIPKCGALTGDWIEFNKTGLDLFFLYGAVKCGDLKPCKTPDNIVMILRDELLEAVKQDRYAYIELAARKDNQIFGIAITVLACVVFLLFR